MSARRVGSEHDGIAVWRSAPALSTDVVVL
jgi:hypothetical protein